MPWMIEAMLKRVRPGHDAGRTPPLPNTMTAQTELASLVQAVSRDRGITFADALREIQMDAEVRRLYALVIPQFDAAAEWERKMSGDFTTTEKRLAQKHDGGPTPKQYADRELQRIVKRFESRGMSAHDAWTAALSDPEGKRHAANYRAPNAECTAAELAQMARDGLRAAVKTLAATRAGEPDDLHAAVVAEQQRGGGSYIDALDRTIANPRHRGLVEKYQRGEG